MRRVLAGRIQTGLWGNTCAMEVTPTTEELTGQNNGPLTKLMDKHPAMAIKPSCVSSPRRSEQGQSLGRLPWPGV